MVARCIPGERRHEAENARYLNFIIYCTNLYLLWSWKKRGAGIRGDSRI